MKACMWATIGIALGARSLALLATANLCVNAARGSTTVSTYLPLRGLRKADRKLYQVAQARAWWLELASALAGLAVLSSVVTLYFWFGATHLLSLLWIMGIGLPARCNGPIRACAHSRYFARSARAGFGVVVVAAVAMIEPRLDWIAAALAAREWLTTLAIAFSAKIGGTGQAGEAQDEQSCFKTAPTSVDLPPSGADFIRFSALLSRRRLIFNASRSILHLVFGPFGTATARVLRHARVFRNVSGHRHVQSTLPVFAAGTIAASMLLVWLVPGPGALLASAFLLSLGLQATSATAWTLLDPNNVAIHPLLDEEDD